MLLYLFAVFFVITTAQSQGSNLTNDTSPDAWSNRSRHSHFPLLVLPDQILYPDLTSSQPLTTYGTIRGYGWIFYKFYVPPDSDSMIDLVLLLESSAGQDNCKGFYVSVNLNSERPQVEDRATSAVGHQSFWDNVLYTFFRMTQESILCESCSHVGVSEKHSNTSPNGTWWFMVQTRGGMSPAHDNVTCTFKTQLVVRDRTHFVRLGTILVLTIGGVLVVRLILFLKMFLSPQFVIVPWNATFVMILTMPPKYIAFWLKAFFRFLKLRVEGFWDWLQLRTRDMRGGGPERELITPGNNTIEMTSVASDASPPSSISHEADNTSEDSEAISCRICRDETSQEELIQPCACTGTMAYVHRACLDQWRSQCLLRDPTTAARCEVCHAQFAVSEQYTRLDIAARLMRAEARHAMSHFLEWVCAFLLVVVVGYVATAGLGSVSCTSVWHSVRHTSPLHIEHYVIGFVFYTLSTWLVYHVGYICYWMENNEEDDVRPYRQSTRLVQGMVWVIASSVWSGYALKFLLYLSFDFVVWDNEVGLISGFCVLCLLAGALGLVMAGVSTAVRAATTPRGGAEPPPDEADDDLPEGDRPITNNGPEEVLTADERGVDEHGEDRGAREGPPGEDT